RFLARGRLGARRASLTGRRSRRPAPGETTASDHRRPRAAARRVPRGARTAPRRRRGNAARAGRGAERRRARGTGRSRPPATGSLGADRRDRCAPPREARDPRVSPRYYDGKASVKSMAGPPTSPGRVRLNVGERGPTGMNQTAQQADWERAKVESWRLHILVE